MAKKRKKRRTAKQIAAFKKMRAGLKRWQKANPRKGAQRPVRRKVGRRVVARGARKVGRRTVARRVIPRAGVRRAAPAAKRFYLKRGIRWWDGAAFTRSRAGAASYDTMTAAKRIATRVANATRGNVSIHG